MPETHDNAAEEPRQTIAGEDRGDTDSDVFDDVPADSDVFDETDGELLALDHNEIRRYFAVDGPLAALFPDYEPRSSQQKMAECVAEICNSGIHGVIEAPTGTGKSLAYLIPLLAWSLLNKTRVLIATHTINLQHQHFEKDIPLVKKILGNAFQAVLVKGRTNYVCCRRVHEAMLDKEGSLFPKENIPELEGIAGWLEKSAIGDRSELANISDEVWDAVASDIDLCAGQHCSFLNACFFRKARRRAMEASVLVTNHALFFSDLGMRMDKNGQGVLPPVDRIVLDEAHNIEDVATDCFGSELQSAAIYKQLGRLVARSARGGRAGGYLVQLDTALAAFGEMGTSLGYIIREEITPLVSKVTKELEPAFTRMQTALSEHFGFEGAGSFTRRVQRRDTAFIAAMEEIFASLKHALHQLAESLQNLYTRCQELPRGQGHGGSSQSSEPRAGADFDDDNRFAYLREQLGNYAQKFASFGHFLHDFVLLGQDDMVYWAERRVYKDRPRLILHSSPISIRRLMNDALHARAEGVCYTSATLANDEGNFSFFLDRIGLDELPQEGYFCRQLPTEFDYSSRVLLAVHTAFPERPDANFADQFACFARDFVEITKGRVFFLFTSWNLLRECHAATMALLSEEWQSTCLRQGDLDRMRLLEAFRSMPRAILFGTSSFWEGVDVKGKGLIAVVIVRLPFQVPDDPLVKARTEAIEEQGRVAFREYSLPFAVIKFRQGFGRLMRSREDYGTIVVLDPRMATKPYGKIFFRSLPPCAYSVGDDQKVLSDVETFLARYECD